MGKKKISVEAFSEWMSTQPELSQPDRFTESVKKICGDVVNNKIESRLGIERLNNQIKSHNPDIIDEQVKRLSKSFKDNGGVIKEMLDMDVLIATENGNFKLPKCYTKPI